MSNHANPVFSHRQVEAADLSEICRFPKNELETFHFFPTATLPLTPQQLNDMMKGRFAHTVVLSDKTVGGFASLYHCNNPVGCYIGNLIISPNCRNTGLSSYLVKTMIQQGFEQFNQKSLNLCCFSDNLAGLRLYDSFGFKPFDLEFRSEGFWKKAALIHFKLFRHKSS